MVFNRYYSKQQGFLLPIALFLIVVASGAALIISKQLEQSALLSVDLILYDKSLYAAETGAQLGLNHLLFGGQSTEGMSIDADKANYLTQCEVLNINRVFTLIELKNCQLAVSCKSHSVNTDNYHYTIESIASCKTTNITEGIESKDSLLEAATQKVIISRVFTAQSTSQL